MTILGFMTYFLGMEIKQIMQRSKHSNELMRRSFAKEMEPKRLIKNILDVRFVI
jgi:hypothetical protein